MADDLNADTVPTLLLDRYRVEGLLGEGGLGTVIKAFDTRLKRMVAIKTLKRSSYTADPSLFRALEERFAREAEAGSRMGSNANLVTVYDLVTDADRTQYLILEYVAGGTLADRIRSCVAWAVVVVAVIAFSCPFGIVQSLQCSLTDSMSLAA